MSTESEEASEKNPEKKEKIERVSEGTFGGTRDRLSDVEGDEPVPDDTGDQGHGQNWEVEGKREIPNQCCRAVLSIRDQLEFTFAGFRHPQHPVS
jgi:hypothetical protein